jgi:hypothetical protein
MAGLSITGSDIRFSDGSTQAVSGKIINLQRVTNNTRTGWSDSGNYTYWSPAVTKLQSGSNLLVEVHLSMRGNYSDCLIHEVQYAGSSWFQGTQPYDAGFSANARPFRSTFYLTGVTNTGSNTLNIRWRTNNGSSGDKPAQIWNPNANEDNRLNQQYSSMEIYEII